MNHDGMSFRQLYRNQDPEFCIDLGGTLNHEFQPTVKICQACLLGLMQRVQNLEARMEQICSNKPMTE